MTKIIQLSLKPPGSTLIPVWTSIHLLHSPLSLLFILVSSSSFSTLWWITCCVCVLLSCADYVRRSELIAAAGGCSLIHTQTWIYTPTGKHRQIGLFVIQMFLGGRNNLIGWMKHQKGGAEEAFSPAASDSNTFWVLEKWKKEKRKRRRLQMFRDL